MKTLNSYIIEKFKISKDIEYKNDMENFIDSFDDEEDKKEIVHLIKCCLHEIQYKNYDDSHWCYVVKPKNVIYDVKYQWSSNKSNIKYEIGDTTDTSSKVLFVVKKGDELPYKYEKYE